MLSFGELIQSDKPVLVDFFATWCGPCKAMTPILHDVKAAMGDEIKVVKIDIDKNKQLTSQFNVQGVPTLILFQNGEIKWRQAGVVQARQLQAILRDYMA